MSYRDIIEDAFADDSEETVEEATDRLVAALEKAGYRIVPIRPTRAMVQVWRELQKDSKEHGPSRLWRAMANAA